MAYSSDFLLCTYVPLNRSFFQSQDKVAKLEREITRLRSSEAAARAAAAAAAAAPAQNETKLMGGKFEALVEKNKNLTEWREQLIEKNKILQVIQLSCLSVCFVFMSQILDYRVCYLVFKLSLLKTSQAKNMTGCNIVVCTLSKLTRTFSFRDGFS